MYVTLSHAKKHLNIDADFKEDDNYIVGLLVAAEKAVERHIDNKLSLYTDAHGELEQPLKAAILLLVGNLYANREPVGYSTAIEVPLSYNYLLDLYKNYSNSNLNESRTVTRIN